MSASNAPHASAEATAHAHPNAHAQAESAPRRKVVFFGSPAFALPVLEALHENFQVVLVVSQPDKPVGRGLKLTPPPIAARAAELGLPLAQPQRVRGNAELLATLRETKADVAVSCAYGQLLPKEVLSAFPYGVLNTHTSLLPKLRGAAPIQWALIRGEVVTGTTIMQTDAGMDTGPIVLQQRQPIFPEWTAVELSEALSKQAAQLVVKAVHHLPQLEAQPQDEAQATYAPLLTKEDGFVRWNHTARQIVARYRGVAAWPQTTAFVGGERVKLHGLSIAESRYARADARAGRILGADGDAILVETGGEELRIEMVQPASKKPQPAAAWAEAHGLLGSGAFDLWEAEQPPKAE